MSHDAIVVGAGPNGLTAAATLAKAGLSTLVCEAQPHLGGAAATAPLTQPGFLHDVGGAFFPFGPVSPGFRHLELEGAGLTWLHAPLESVHLDAQGGCAALARDPEAVALLNGSDGQRWNQLAAWRRRLGARFDRLALDPLPLLEVIPRLDPLSLWRFAELTASSTSGYGRRHFETAIAQRVVADLSLHADLGPDDFGGAVLGGVLALMALTTGFPVAAGGAGAITQTLARRLAEAGGEVRLSAPVTRIRVVSGQVRGVTLASGEAFDAPLVLADVSAPRLVFELVGPEQLPGRLVTAMRGFRQAWGTFKLDWALDGPVPWQLEPPRRASVVHLADNLAGLSAFTDEVRAGRLPESPYLVIGQQSLADPHRAPPGKHTLYAYTHVPAAPNDGAWPDLQDRFADRIEETIEAQAPGFRQVIRARHLVTPIDLERGNANLAGGDLGGGTAQLDNLLFFRPAFPFFRYRLGVKGLFLCSAYTHPGAGVHGACGYNAARVALGRA